MGRFTVSVAALLAASFFPCVVFCAPPGVISYQGKLTDAAGVPQNGLVSLTFSIYDAALQGNCLWGPESHTTNVCDGVFAAQLGIVSPIAPSVFESESTYLEIKIGEHAISPRTRIVSVPYALVTAHITPENVAQILRLIKTLPDADGDGYAKVSQGGNDCDDTDAEVHPGAAEVCDGIDNDCDGQADEENAVGCTTYYADADADGYGIEGHCRCLCMPTGHYSATVTGDCDDADPAVHPSATETCNGKDDDCDGVSDPEGSAGCTAYYRDMDADGYGVAGDSRCLCAPSGAYQATNAGDCNDADSTVNPGASEKCNGKDDDCDGLIDEQNALGCVTYYRDVDADGYGVTGDSKCLCAPSGLYQATNGGDCNDADSTVNPGASEKCNGKDDDCDGLTDEQNALGCVTYYRDMDGDGYGVTGDSKCLCAPSGVYQATVGGDCDDTNPTLYPGHGCP